MKIIVITGASDGIGAEMARQLAGRYGADVGLVLAARDERKLGQVSDHCLALGARVLVVRTDVSVEAECRQLVDATVAHFGRLDALINNAGMSAQALFEDVKATDLAWYEQLMRINLWGSVWCTHAALPHLRKTKGLVVAVASVAGFSGIPTRTLYSASKHAMVGFFESLRIELLDSGVGVSLIAPDFVVTEIHARAFGSDGQPIGSGTAVQRQ